MFSLKNIGSLQNPKNGKTKIPYFLTHDFQTASGRFFVVLVGISLITGPVVAWADKGPCTEQLPNPAREGGAGCTNGSYGGTEIIHYSTWVCKDEDESDCKPNANTRKISDTYVYTTQQSDAQKKAQKDMLDTLNRNYRRCIRGANLAMVGGGLMTLWSGPAGIIVVFSGFTTSELCQNAYEQHLEAYNGMVASCQFVSPKRGVPIPANGPSCQ